MSNDLAAPPTTSTAPARRARRLRPRLIGELLIIAFLLRIYDLIKELSDRKRSIGLANGGHVVSLERTLRIDWERSVNHWVNDRHALAVFCSYWYQFAHESITLAVLAWLWWCRPLQYRRARNALVVINVIGLAVFALFPVAPPRLLPGGGIVDSVARAGFGTVHRGPVDPDQFAAMPSLHLAWATWTVAMLMLNTRRRWVRVLEGCYLLWMTFVVIGTGNHYVLDAVAGFVVAVGALAATYAMRPQAIGWWSRSGADPPPAAASTEYHARLAAVGSRPPPGDDAPPWWRRLFAVQGAAPGQDSAGSTSARSSSQKALEYQPPGASSPASTPPE